MYYVAYTPTYLIIDSGLTDLHPDFKFVNFDAPAALTALDNSTMLRCLAALAFETEGQLPAEPATIIFDLVTQAELPVSLGERVAEPALEPAQGATTYYVIHTPTRLSIWKTDGDLPAKPETAERYEVRTSEDLDAMPSDLMLRALRALGYDRAALPPEASDYTFKLMQRTNLPVTFDGELEPLPTVKNNRKTKKKDLPAVEEQTISSSPGDNDVSNGTGTTTMTDQEKKAALKAKNDAAKLKAKEKADAAKLKAKEAKEKEKTKLQAAKDKDRDAKAKAKEKAAADKAKEPRKQREIKKDGAVYQLKLLVLKQPNINNDQIAEKLSAKGVTMSPASVATFRQDFVHSLRVLKNEGYDVPVPV